MAIFEETTVREINCPSCHSKYVVKVGKQNGQQRYLCRGCSKKFRANGMPEGRRVPAEQMGMAVRMFYSGMSYKQIAETLADAFNIPEPSKSTIYDWVEDYTDKATTALSQPQYHAQVGVTWVADEMQVRVGGEKMWNWNVMDEKTRYILASHLSKQRNLKAAETVMEKAATASATEPKTIKTDRLASYPYAISLVFPDTKHIQSDGIRAEVNNNLSERLQGTFRQREKTLRGLDNLESGQRYLDGWTITYNFFREHESIDETPGEAAKVKIPYEDWADVVREGSGVVEPKMTEAKPPKVAKAPPQIVVADIQKMGEAGPPLRESGKKVRITPPRSPERRTPRMFQSAAAKGRTAKSPAWLRRSEVKGRL